MPVGTLGTVKSLTPADLREIGAEIVLANTYHLFLRPGHALIAELGGLHRFMAWDGPILTDSGGYQVWSLAALRTIREEGVRFRSHLDGGAEHLLTPELVVEVQQALGVDILHPLDECLPHPAPREAAEASLRRTLRWARRAHAAHLAGRRPGQACFGIVQGGMYGDLRRAAVEETCALGWDGHALGGFAVGEPRGLMRELVALTADALPADRPRYLMGVGRPGDLVDAVASGIDMFDCVLPTRHARTGQAFTRQGPVDHPPRRPRPVGGAARPVVPLLRVPALLARLPAAPLPGAGAHRVPAPHAPQPDLLSRLDGRPARRHRGRHVRRAADGPCSKPMARTTPSR